MCARAEDPEHEVPQAGLVEDFMGILGVALERAPLDEACCGGRKECCDAREEEKLNGKGQ